jgi:hypothetical protein
LKNSNHAYDFELGLHIPANGATDCTGDASTYGSLDATTAVRTMKTDTVYDELFCTKCKIMSTFLQSQFFRVKVVSACASNYCDSGNSKGKFIDLTYPIAG